MSFLSIENIHFSYGKTQVIKNFSLQVEEGSFTTLLGESGCGKTTLLNIIGGLDQYTSGDLIINGKSTKDFKDSRLG